jgi:glycyl-tRNA synthetase
LSDPKPSAPEMETIVSLSRRRGFIFQSSDIYGGLASTWDYGPLGVELKRNVKEAWWQDMIRTRDDVVGLDTAILMHPKVWEASGHLENFTDPLVSCKACHQRFRDDMLGEDGKCPSCGGEVTDPQNFNLMFKTFMGPAENSASTVFLRPETAQGIFVNFANVLDTTRKKLPFGIAQTGKSFRNEITTGNFIFRSREFEQMELEYFVKPDTADAMFEYWVSERFNWYVNLGVKKENLRLAPHPKESLAHYARACTDVEYYFPMGWSELEGVANRGDFDLAQHQTASGRGLTYFDEEAKEHYLPYIIEPSAGVDRSVLAFLCDAYADEPDGDETRAVLHLHPRLAPFKAAVLPLSKKEPVANLAKEIHRELRRHWSVSYDETQSIGRRYRRQDEIGTPYCITADFDSLEDKQVTIRDRDTMEQVRVPIDELVAYLREKLA